MKVSLWYNNRDIRLEEAPTPRPGPNELLARVMACGICGSDVVEWYRLPRAPLVQGHEVGAQVVEVGAALAAKYKPGDRVFLAPKVPCLQCRYCREGHYPQCSVVKERLPGAFAEYVLVPGIIAENGSLPLPDHVTYDQSTFIEPLACVVRAQRLARVKAGQSLLVLGCGMSGLLHVKLARAQGARVVASDINPRRLAWAQKAGAAATINAAEDVPRRLVAETGRLADVVVLCTSALSAFDTAWKSVDQGGTVVVFAVPGPEKATVVPLNDFWRKEITILTSYYCGPPDWEQSLDLIASGRIVVDDMITHVLPLSRTAEGFRLVLDGQESLKVIIRPNE
ncbi:MAG TPA: zinc-binding dehydrogenase [Planctomycetota bacterium]|nr:zinc-binding dehydrogenase [Planctomycetota bacterium]HRR79240.1 zinc-binding dehydrogenase [Planctomycetota bacterium]